MITMNATSRLCRICLLGDATLINIANSPLQTVFENLTKLSLLTPDQRSVGVCCVCRALLNKSRKLMVTALKADAVLSGILGKAEQQSVLVINRQALGLCGELRFSKVEFLDSCPRVEIKVEPKIEEVVVEMQLAEGSPQPEVSVTAVKEEVPEEEISFLDIGPVTLTKSVEGNIRMEEGNQGEPRRENGAKRHQCDTCQRVFENKNNLKNHLRTHTGETPFSCDVCQQAFNRISSLHRHKKTHTGEKSHECHICHRRFRDKNNLITHYNTHASENPYECGECKRKFRQKRFLTAHFRKCHADKQHCGKCLSVFKSDSALQSHVCLTKCYECHICNDRFKMESHLQMHVLSHTSGPFECSVCKLTFSEKSSMQNHMRTHTNRKLYECNVCNKKLTRKYTLIKHMRIHTGEKPYGCDVCGWRFNEKNNYLAHYRCHNGEKPFECGYCQRRFNQRNNLNAHIRTHTGEKPYACECGKRFNQRSNLTVHLKSHATNDT